MESGLFSHASATGAARLLPVWELSGLFTAPGMTKCLKWPAILRKAASASHFRIPIPETWSSDQGGQLLYSNDQGIVKMRQGFKAAEFFQHTTHRDKYCDYQPLCPKYVQIGSQGPVKLLYSKADLCQALRLGHTVQRYIPPANSLVHKLVFHWRKGRPTQGYRVFLPRSIEGRLKGNDITLSAIMWLHHVDACEVVREGNLGADMEESIEKVRETVEACGMKAGEELEELIISGIRAKTGHVLILNCERAKIRDVGQPNEPLITLNSSFTVPLNLLAADQTFLPLLKRSKPDPATEYANNYLTQVAKHRDQMFSQAKSLKQHNLKLVQQLNVSGYPVWFIPRCVERVYEEVEAESRLKRYFPIKERICSHVQASINQVFSKGTTRSRIISIHKNMRIEESDFNLYVQQFETVLTDIGMPKADVQKVIAYLSSFKDCIAKEHVSSFHSHSHSLSLILP